MSAAKEVKQPEPKAAKAKEKEKRIMVYIGPSIKNLVSSGTVYNNGVPEALIQEMEDQPVIKSLLIPVEELAEARRELAQPGSALKIIYDKVITN